jgi:hypothetical protein
MRKTRKKPRGSHHRTSTSKPHHEADPATERKRFNFRQLRSNLERISRVVIHDYAIPLTRAIESRLLRLEQSL